jgi:beta-lactamase class A
MKAMIAYLADIRDTATPRGMAGFLSKLDAGELISPASTSLLLTLMGQVGGAADRLKAGLPPGAQIAHKPGTSGSDQGLTPAFNDVGIFTLADRRRYVATAFLSGSTADDKDRAALLADLGRAFAAATG